MDIVVILWMEEILHQLVDGLSHCNPIIYSVFIVPNSYQLVQDFFHPPYGVEFMWYDWYNGIYHHIEVMFSYGRF